MQRALLLLITRSVPREIDALSQGQGLFFPFETVHSVLFILLLFPAESCTLSGFIWVPTRNDENGYLLAVDDCTRNAYTAVLAGTDE